MNALKNWAIRHAQTAVGTLGRLSHHWVSAVIMIFVIGIALTLPALMKVGLNNARLAGGDLQHGIELAIYLKPTTTLTRAQQIAGLVRDRDDVSRVRFVSADEGLTEFRRRSGFGDALIALGDNPLPHSIIVQPRNTEASALDSLTTALKQITDVDAVRLDSVWVQRFNAMVSGLQRANLILQLLLGIGVVVIVGSAIRADIQTRRDEIEVTKLVGGSDAFARRPFLYTGIWFGLGGGLLAIVITTFAVAALSAPVRRIAALYGSPFELSGLGPIDALALLGTAAALGWIGSFVVATRYIRAIEPN